MNNLEVYLLFEHDDNTIIHGFEIGKDLALKSARRLVKELSNSCGRDLIYVSKVNEVHKLNFKEYLFNPDLLEGAEAIYYPNWDDLESAKFDINICETLEELDKTLKSLEEVCLDEEEVEELKKFTDEKRSALENAEGEK